MSCLFRALGALVGLHEDTLRRQICDYLTEDPVLFSDLTASRVMEWEGHKSLGAYVPEMRDRSTWGGAIEIKAFCDMYRAQVLVHDLRPSPPKSMLFVGTGSRQERRPLEITWNGYHFEPKW